MAAADPVSVVGGNINYGWGDPAFLSSLSGTGFSASGSFGDDGGYYPPYSTTTCAGCSIDPSISESVTSPSILFEVDGQQYLSSAMAFTIQAGPLAVPDNIGSGQFINTGPAPFEFSGWVEGTPWHGTGPVRHVDLNGKGEVRLSFGERHWFNSYYTFGTSSSPAPVPEPGTLLLVATGALGIGRKMWTRFAA